MQQQENECDCGVLAFVKCLVEGKDSSQYDIVNILDSISASRDYSRVFKVASKTSATKNIKKHEVVFLCLMQM